MADNPTAIRIRVRTNFAVNTKSVTHDQTIELDAPVVPGETTQGEPTLLVEIEPGVFESWDIVYRDALEQAREIAAHELEHRTLRFLPSVKVD